MTKEYKKLSEEIWGAIILDVDWAINSELYKQHDTTRSIDKTR